MGGKLYGGKLIKNKMGMGIWNQEKVAYDHLQIISHRTYSKCHVETFSSFHVIDILICIDYGQLIYFPTNNKTHYEEI